MEDPNKSDQNKNKQKNKAKLEGGSLVTQSLRPRRRTRSLLDDAMVEPDKTLGETTGEKRPGSFGLISNCIN